MRSPRQTRVSPPSPAVRSWRRPQHEERPPEVSCAQPTASPAGLRQGEDGAVSQSTALRRPGFRAGGGLRWKWCEWSGWRDRLASASLSGSRPRGAKVVVSLTRSRPHPGPVRAWMCMDSRRRTTAQRPRTTAHWPSTTARGWGHPARPISATTRPLCLACVTFPLCSRLRKGGGPCRAPDCPRRGRSSRRPRRAELPRPVPRRAPERSGLTGCTDVRDSRGARTFGTRGAHGPSCPAGPSSRTLMSRRADLPIPRKRSWGSA